MNMDECRAEIDKLDEELVRLFSRRMELSYEIGKYKREQLLPVHDPAREDEIAARLRALSPRFAQQTDALYRTIFALSREYQTQIAKNDEQ